MALQGAAHLRPLRDQLATNLRPACDQRPQSAAIGLRKSKEKRKKPAHIRNLCAGFIYFLIIGGPSGTNQLALKRSYLRNKRICDQYVTSPNIPNPYNLR